jgi:pilus assembly protein CpaB
MASRRILLLAVAGIVAVGTIYMARSMMATPDTVVKAPPPIQTTEILAASHDMSTGTILKESDVKWVQWPAEAPTTRLYVKGKNELANVTGGVLREGIRGDEPITLGRVVQPHEQGFLAAVLTPGKRAMSVTLTPSAEVAGFIFPGDHVDVILTHSFSRKDVPGLTERRMSETVLTDVRVLALDQKSDNQVTDPKVAALATLEVTPKQAEKLALSADMVSQGGMGRGSIALVLRSLATDDANTPANGSAPGTVTDANLGTASNIPPVIVMPAPPTGPTWDSEVSPAYPSVTGEDGLMQKVQIMRGKDVSETNFQRHDKP